MIVAGRMNLAAPAAVVGGIFVSRLTSLLSRKWKSLSLRWINRPHSLLPTFLLSRLSHYFKCSSLRKIRHSFGRRYRYFIWIRYGSIAMPLLSSCPELGALLILEGGVNDLVNFNEI